MTSQVFYRKWRPQTLAEVTGQEQVTRTLRNALETGRVSHAYLFCGPRGTGKTSTGRILAKAVNCLNNGKGEPCNACQMCQAITDGSALDVIEIDAASNRKIDDIRDLRERIKFAPNQARYKVYIIDEVHALTNDASNALLKTLEEPPSYVVLIVLATDADRLLPTIVSRCQQVPLRPLPISTVQQALIDRWDVDPTQAELLAHLSGGRLGWAVTRLRDDGALQRRAQRLDDLAQLLTAPTPERFRYAERLARNPGATRETLDTWIGWWRDVLLLASQTEAPLINIDRQAALKDHARRFPVARSAALLEALRSAVDRLRRNANPRLTLEVLMLDLPRP